MKHVRTLTALRDELKGKIYIYLDNVEICKRFLQDAENEGFRFGKIKPTDSDGSNIIALGKNRQLSYVGFVGHMAFQCLSGVKGGFYRIDYRKFVNGDTDYTYSDNTQPKIAEFSGKFYDTVMVAGDNYRVASAYIQSNLERCEDTEQEETLYAETSDKFNVIVVEE